MAHKHPLNRRNHAACFAAGCIFISGGRCDNNNICNDLWKYSCTTLSWELMKCRGEKPNYQEGHTLVNFQNKLLSFGGQFSRNAPVFFLDLDLKYKQPMWMKCEAVGPASRRYHSAVMHNGLMYIFGGFVDMLGSTSELWQFDPVSLKWTLLYDPKMNNIHLLERHAHSAVTNHNVMWIYGGACKFKTKGDLVAWNFDEQKWSRVKTSVSPPSRHNHSAVDLGNTMVVVGGVHKRKLLDDTWTFTYTTRTWCQLTPVQNLSPMSARSHHCTLCSLPPSLTRIASDQSLDTRYFKNTISPLNIEDDSKLLNATSFSPKKTLNQCLHKSLTDITTLDSVFYCIKSTVKPLHFNNEGDNDYSKHSPIKMSNKQAWTEHLSTEKLFTKSDNPLTAATPIEEMRSIIILGGVVAGRSNAEPRSLSCTKITVANNRLAFISEN